MKSSLLLMVVFICVTKHVAEAKEHKYITIPKTDGTYRFQYGQYQALPGKLLVDLYLYDEIGFNYYNGHGLKGNMVTLHNNGGKVIEFLFTVPAEFAAVEQKILTLEAVPNN